jgi:hypothetical protein
LLLHPMLYGSEMLYKSAMSLQQVNAITNLVSFVSANHLCLSSVPFYLSFLLPHVVFLFSFHS